MDREAQSKHGINTATNANNKRKRNEKNVSIRNTHWNLSLSDRLLLNWLYRLPVIKAERKQKEKRKMGNERWIDLHHDIPEGRKKQSRPQLPPSKFVNIISLLGFVLEISCIHFQTLPLLLFWGYFPSICLRLVSRSSSCPFLRGCLCRCAPSNRQTRNTKGNIGG